MTATDRAGRVGEAPAPAELVFPPGFFWGAATASFQIEGATTADGRGQSIWDTFAATPGKVLNGDTGEPACDHYRRYADDVALMSELGLDVYRFSVAWPRIQPAGSGPVEQRGLAFYDRLVDELLGRGIRPMPTLYHWDLPQALQDKGGWVDRDTALRFAEYAQIVHSALADRVSTWTTLNEPWCSAFLGYCSGIHAPGVTDPLASLQAAHHLLLGHGLATGAMRAQAPDHEFSVVLNFSPVWTDGVDERHREAVRKVDGLQNRILLDPLLGRGYPADVLADVDWLGEWGTVIRGGDLATIATPVDWIGVNFYQPAWVAPADDPVSVTPGSMPGLRGVEMLPPRGELTGFGWEQDASALTELLLWLHRESPRTPIVVTENGSAFPDRVEDGEVIDHGRTQYLLDHVRAVHTAIQHGANVRGYLAWSLLDNFEWAVGYSQRFGMVHVDFETQQRTIKHSGHTLAELARNNGIRGA
jgi:beta-glucosidase